MNQAQLKKYQEIYEHLYFGGDRLTLNFKRVWEIKLKEGQNDQTFYDFDDLLKANLDTNICTVWVTYELHDELALPESPENDEDSEDSEDIEEDDSEEYDSDNENENSFSTVSFNLITDADLEFLWKQVEVKKLSVAETLKRIEDMQNKHLEDIDSNDGYILMILVKHLESFKGQ